MSGLLIDRLMLEIPDMPEEEGRKLAMEVAKGLLAAPGAADISVLRISVEADEGESHVDLAQKVLDQIMVKLS
jgi:hypothetical protein